MPVEIMPIPRPEPRPVVVSTEAGDIEGKPEDVDVSFMAEAWQRAFTTPPEKIIDQQQPHGKHMSNLFAEVEARQDIKINNLTGAETSVDRDIAGRIIDTTWSYSRHWPEQHRNWEPQALKDATSSQESLIDEMSRISMQLGHISTVKLILERAVAYYHERQLPEVDSE